MLNKRLAVVITERKSSQKPGQKSYSLLYFCYCLNTLEIRDQKGVTKSEFHIGFYEAKFSN